MNIAKIMIPKVFTVFLHETDTVRQGLERFSRHGYTAIPVLNEEEQYVGSVTEGDFLRHLLAGALLLAYPRPDGYGIWREPTWKCQDKIRINCCGQSAKKNPVKDMEN